MAQATAKEILQLVRRQMASLNRAIQSCDYVGTSVLFSCEEDRAVASCKTSAEARGQLSSATGSFDRLKSLVTC